MKVSLLLVLLIAIKSTRIVQESHNCNGAILGYERQRETCLKRVYNSPRHSVME